MLAIAMLRSYGFFRTAAVLLIGASAGSNYAAAQWIKYPTPGVPRKAGGSVDMFAPGPRLAGGKPDFSGIWTTAEPNLRRSSETLSTPKEMIPKTPRSETEAQTPGDPSNIIGARQMSYIG